MARALYATVLLSHASAHRPDAVSCPWAAIRKVAFKWIRILWRCWQDRQPYDQARYLRALQQHRVTLYAPLYSTLPAASPTA